MGSPRTRLRFARILIVAGTLIGIVSILQGAWFTTLAMALVILSQVAVSRRAQRELRTAQPELPSSRGAGEADSPSR